MADTDPEAPEDPFDALTPMQRRYVEHRLSHPNATPTQSALAAGVASHKSAMIRSSQWNATESVRKAATRALEEVGLDPLAAARRLLLDVDAKKFGLTKDGQVVDMGRDSIASVKALDLLYRVTGALDTKVDVNVTGAVIHLTEARLDPFGPGSAIDVTPSDPA